MNFGESYRGKRVFLTGHTGFKGAWLSEWLLSLGAKVTGYSLPPPTDPALFVQLGLAPRLHHLEGDIRDSKKLSEAISTAQPDFVFHLAAQPLVRFSYQEPRATYEVNVMGTVNVLEALRSLKKKCAAVMITTDKCYENREWLHSYRENDGLGGYDPYSSSKAAAEIAIGGYRQSFFTGSSIAVASARAGNVIGGGDWASDRLVPDCIRHLQKGESIRVRNRCATRPWQHVLEPLSGYLSLGASLFRALSKSDETQIELLASAFNFGPGPQSNRSVGQVVDRILARWPGQSHDQAENNAPHEAHRLNLNAEKAVQLLAWQPVWSFAEAIDQTVDWYRQTHERASRSPKVSAKLIRAQINEYETARMEKELERS